MDQLLFYFCLFSVIYIEGVRCKNHHKLKLSDNTDVKIVGGNQTTIETYPYQAFLLLYDGSYYYQCGGSIITKNHIVTAAHCLEGIQKIYVRIGSTNSSSGGTQYVTTSFYSHPRYNSHTSDFDAGVIRIPGGMNLDGTNAKAITMVNVGYDPKDKDEVILTGWGATSENGSTSNTLMVVQVPVVSRTRCNELLYNGITSRMFCAGLDQGGKDACQGDSGGPAVTSSSGKLVGITSFGYGCAQPNLPGVYTLVGNIQVRTFIKIYTGV